MIQSFQDIIKNIKALFFPQDNPAKALPLDKLADTMELDEYMDCLPNHKDTGIL